MDDAAVKGSKEPSQVSGPSVSDERVATSVNDPHKKPKAKIIKTIDKTTKRAKSKTSASRNSKKDFSIEKSASTRDNAKFPRHAVDKVLRIPKAIIDQNAGRDCSDRESAAFVGVGFNGPYSVEISSALKYGFLTRPKPSHISVTDRARQALRPQNAGDDISALRNAVLAAPDVSAVYKHYRGENIPDRKFFENALIDNFGIPAGKIPEFTEIFFDSLKAAHLIEQNGEKLRIIDATENSDRTELSSETFKKATKILKIDQSVDSCFVVMPFSSPVGDYYQSIYEPAIKKSGLKPIRADADIFGTGKIIDQIWFGINAAKVLVAELTGRNPNVFYELGLAHALHKPVVLISSNSEDVPFDLKHIRVIYYNVNDPFWGSKLIDKVAENIVSALKNPEEAVFERALETSR